MSAYCLPPPRTPPKYERLRRMAERFPEWNIDLSAMESYKTALQVASEVWGAAGVNLARYGLGEGRFTVLAMLLENLPDPLSHSELADLSCVTKGSITGLVDGLEHDGLVKREDSGEDRRVRLIALTPAGKQVIEKALPDHLSRIALLMAGLSPAERATLMSLLAKIQDGVPAFQGE